MEETIGVRKTASGGFGMMINEQGFVSSGSESALLGRQIVAVRGEPVCSRCGSGLCGRVADLCTPGAQ